MEKTCSCFDFNYRILADVVEDAIVVCEHDRICLVCALLINGQASLEWLSADPPNLSRASRTMENLVRNSQEAADVVTSLRMLISSPRTLNAGDGVHEAAVAIDQRYPGVLRARMLGDGEQFSQARSEPA